MDAAQVRLHRHLACRGGSRAFALLIRAGRRSPDLVLQPTAGLTKLTAPPNGLSNSLRRRQISCRAQAQKLPPQHGAKLFAKIGRADAFLLFRR